MDKYGIFLLIIFGIICAIAFVGLTIYSIVCCIIYKDEESDIEDSILPGACVFSLMLAIIINIISWTKYSVAVDSYDRKTYDIYSMKNVTTITHGTFVLGTGYVDTDMYYCFYVKENDMFKLEKIIAEGTYIKETNEVSPCVREIKEEWEYAEHIIYVPEGTITIEWQL